MNSMKIGTYQMDTSFGLYLPEYTIPAPTPQTHFVQIIGRDGSVDLSEAIGLHYDSRVWDLDFKCFDPTVNWHTLTSQVMNAIHGKRLNFEFDDDPNYFWTGRISVSSYVSTRGTGTLKVNITSDPFKYAKLSTIVTKNASTGTDYTGALVSFNTANAKINDLSVTMQPIQSGSGTPSPDNVRPITGRTGLNVYRTGFNLCQDSVHTNHYWESGVLKTNKNANYAAIDIKVPVVPGADYCVYLPDNTSGGRVYVSFFDASESFIGQENYTIGSTNVFTTTADTRFVAIGFYKSGGVLVGERICVSLSGANDGTYEPYNGSTYAVDWTSEAGTVYGGTLDVVTGVLTSTMANIASYNGETITEPWLSSMDAYASGATPTTGAQVVYTLSTPMTYQLTPQEVATLVGQNNVWSDSGDVTVTVVTPETVTNNGLAVVPTLTASADMVLKWGNYSASVQQGTSTVPQLILENGANLICIIGTGTLSFAWQEASL